MTWWECQWVGPHIPLYVFHSLWQKKSSVCLQSSTGQSWKHQKVASYKHLVVHWCGMAHTWCCTGMCQGVLVISMGSATRVGSCVVLGATKLAFPQLWNNGLDEITTSKILSLALWSDLWQGTANLADKFPTHYEILRFTDNFALGNYFWNVMPPKVLSFCIK